LNDLNAWLEQRCKDLWKEIAHPEDPSRMVADVWEDERKQLMAVPAPFDGYVEHTKRVSSTCLILCDRNRYSVPAAFANKPVSVRAYAGRIVVVAEAQVVAQHTRVFSRHHKNGGITVYDWRHYLAVIQRKPGALRNGAPFTELPDAFKCLQRILLKRLGGDREMANILALVLHHDEHLVMQAVEVALESGRPSQQHVTNVLGRLLEGPLPEPLDPPPALVLVNEPMANTQRYDDLRENNHVR